MGYGHLRAAWPLGERLQVPVHRADRPPLAAAAEHGLWRASRRAYESLSRLSQEPTTAPLFGGLLDSVTAIAPHAESRDPAAPDRAARFLAACIERGFGRRLGRRLEEAGAPLLSTFYAPALAAERHSSVPVFCVVTDSDVHRVWAAAAGGRSRVYYLAPSAATAARLESYGIERSRVTVTGFPLPPALVAGARQALEERLERLAGSGRRPPLLTFAVGGAGAQAGRARELLAELGGLLGSGRLRLALVAGLRPRLASAFRSWAQAAGGGTDEVEIVEAASFDGLYHRFNELFGRTDVLWTKPSELSFYAALGLPLILDDPVGDHERANAQMVLEAGAAMRRPEPRSAASAIEARLGDGSFAACAERAFARLPRGGTEAISEFVFNRC